MLSILNEDNLLTDFLGNQINNFLPSNESIPNFGGSFSPPSQALMNVLSTPQLNFSEAFESNDYIENNKNAQNGFSPEENQFTQKFKLEDE